MLMGNEKLQEYIKYLKTHPEAYIEMVAGCKLHWYQKVLLRTMFKLYEKKNKGKINWQIGGTTFATFPTKGVVFELENGSTITTIPSNETVRGNKSKIVYSVYYDENERR
jgi:hypothetical protein